MYLVRNVRLKSQSALGTGAKREAGVLSDTQPQLPLESFTPSTIPTRYLSNLSCGHSFGLCMTAHSR